MRTHIEFRSDALPAEPDEERRINLGRWGAALVRYLCQELSTESLSAKEPYAEDWGYGIEMRRRFRRVDTTLRVDEVADALEIVFVHRL
jgi:hypothetical protein